ncbi:signal transduction histidine kinase [Methanomicrobium sp. W14]|uniref:sensor histidine kinase n=1 Tax=Methanomicrobium sp. W14 TaxID=2817839 RepID=UPI001AEA8A09|nr:HAMP domain-containing sensor histidine kinase [Methanomicrobium sp. W14]MBP2133361.1 signal transduction histidine kinase [Methanomicrobium sp. W14]
MMQKAFVPFIKAYNDSGGDPGNIDLYAIKKELGENYDLYIIDKNHRVISSTKKYDNGLNFSYDTNFCEFLDKALVLGEYHGDRIVRGTRDTLNISKYAYYPSPDREYVLELSYDTKDYSKTRERLKYHATTDSIKEMNPYLYSVKIYDIYAMTIGEPDEPDNFTKNLILQNVIRKRSDFVFKNQTGGTVTRYRYINLSDENFGSDMSVVLAFTYSPESMQKELNRILFSNIVSFLLILSLLVIVFYLATDLMARPIKNIVGDVDEIAKGNLDHRIRISGGREFVSLRNSIENMVGNLKTTIEELKESRRTIKKYNEELEKRVEIRTSDLKEANSEANFYIDLMTHDINNANTAALGYAQMIEESAGEESCGNIKRLISSIGHVTEIISNVSLIRTINSSEKHLKPVSLDANIRNVILHYPDMDIKHEDSGYSVLADELLGEVFSNIIGNSKKYAGIDCKIVITAEEKNDNIIVCVDDNGPGITDEVKKNIFDRLFQEKGKAFKNGSGLGLYIVKNLVEKRYEGKVFADDIIEDHPEHGLRICVMLKKAQTLTDLVDD